MERIQGKGLLFDKCVGYKLPFHLQRMISNPVYTRFDVYQELCSGNSEWKVVDGKYLQFAINHNSIIITYDRRLIKRAEDSNISTIFLRQNLTENIWQLLFIILSKIKHPLFIQALNGWVDLRILWGEGIPHWEAPRRYQCNSLRRRHIIQTDQTYPITHSEKKELTK